MEEGHEAEGGPGFNITTSQTSSPVLTAIHTITGRHLHDIATTVPDDRQFLKMWRRQMQECLTQHNARITRFLLADISGNTQLSDTDISRRCADMLAKYSKSTWSFTSSTRDLALSPPSDTVNAEIEREIGMNPSVVRDAVRRTIRLYSNTAKAMCDVEVRLEEKLKRLETVTERVNDIMFLEPTAELEGLAGPTRIYLDSVLSKLSIETEYTELTALFHKFTILKGLVSLTNFQKTAAPTCSICMTKEITQALTPCGHTFCDDCCRLQMTACYICRLQVRDKLRLYFN